MKNLEQYRAQLLRFPFESAEQVAAMCGVEDSVAARFFAGRRVSEPVMDEMARNLAYAVRGGMRTRLDNLLNSRDRDAVLLQFRALAELVQAGLGKFPKRCSSRNSYAFPPRQAIAQMADAITNGYNTLRQIHAAAPELDAKIFCGTPELLSKLDGNRR